MKKSNGFTLLEVMISLFIGGLILGGVMLTYLSMKVTTRDTMMIGELQETGRLALTIMQRDIEQIGFWGTFYETGFTDDNSTSPSNPSGDCSGGLNNGSFPDTEPTNFRPIYAQLATSSTVLSCVTNAKSQTDAIQLKFLEGNQLLVKTSALSNKYYFIAELEKAEFISGTNLVSKTINSNATLWPYSHHVYYIANESLVINGKTVSVPVLRRKRLTVSGGITDEAIMEGVEDLRLLFGIDTTADGRVNQYRSTNEMRDSDWENGNAILTVQLFILVRSLEEDADLSLTNQTYTLGHDTNKRVHTFSDKYRRTVFSTTVRLNNMGVNLWRM
ncbi:Type IV fimbrial biogenesis protein PilW [Pseudoalteromonas luteoviolacea B = ATCC 29581]|nr:Type IV fimbrial biogenesis protein PilW [Pseudoalteromonas luteoviolacea B = ATCC 29581]